VQVVEVNHMILDVLDRLDDIAHQAGIGRDFDPQSIFDSSHGAECVYSRSNTADSLSEGPRFAGVASFQDDLNTPEHGAAAPGIRDHSTFHFDFQPEVTLDAGDGINRDL
jgi:hypothetical protein